LIAAVPGSAVARSRAAHESFVLDVSSATFLGRTLTAISVGPRGMSSSDVPLTAAVELLVPRGYTVDLALPAGREIGVVFADIADAAGSPSRASTAAVLVVDDPAKYAADPAARACAPGLHAAVWVAPLSVLGQSLMLAVFLDPANGPAAAAAAYELRFCPLWPPSQARSAGLAAWNVTLVVEGAIGLPTAQGRYTWSALVTPAAPGSLVPQPSGTFEVRAIVPMPQRLTLRARYVAKTKTALLSGRFTVLGEPQRGAEIQFVGSTSGGDDVSFFGPVRTNARGEFSIKRAVDRTTRFQASVNLPPRACSGPSSASAGCLSETVTKPEDASAFVVVPRPTDPKRAIRPGDQRLARRATLKAGDFPSGWEAAEADPSDLCDGFRPDLSDVSVSGMAISPTFVSETEVAASRTSVYLTERQARKAFEREAKLAAAGCIADELRAEGVSVRSVGAFAFPKVGGVVRAFRIVVAEEEPENAVVYFDLVSLRVRRVVVHFVFAGFSAPPPSELDLAAKVAARARRG
jgi:hypothetical protein